MNPTLDFNLEMWAALYFINWKKLCPPVKGNRKELEVGVEDGLPEIVRHPLVPFNWSRLCRTKPSARDDHETVRFPASGMMRKGGPSVSNLMTKQSYEPREMRGTPTRVCEPENQPQP